MANGVILRGEIYWICLDDSVGSEEMTGRPAVVVSGNSRNEKDETIIVAYITSAGIASPYNVSIEMNGDKKRILCGQLRTVDKKRLTKYLGALSESELIRVNGALATSLCLPPPQRLNNTVKNPQIDADTLKLQAERDTYKRLYETVLEEFVELRFKRDVGEKLYEVAEPWDSEPPLEPEKVEEQEEVPEYKEPSEPTEPEIPQTEFIPEIVNVNTASAQEISEKTGLPLKDAYAITGYRKKNGLFVELEELLEVSRISKQKFEKYRELFTLGEPEKKNEPANNGLIIDDLVPLFQEPEPAKKVNVNEATMNELIELGFSKPAAGRIVSHRKKYGPYKKVEDLKGVDDVPSKLIRKLKDVLEV